MNEIKPGCFEGAVEVCEREVCNVAKDCIWRRLPEEGGKGPKILENYPESQVMEGGVSRRG